MHVDGIQSVEDPNKTKRERSGEFALLHQLGLEESKQLRCELRGGYVAQNCGWSLAAKVVSNQHQARKLDPQSFAHKEMNPNNNLKEH